MPISLRVQAVPDEASFDRTAERAEKRFGAAGQESGKAFAKGLDDAIAKADPKAVDKWTSAYDRMRDAIGKVHVEQAKLDDLRTRGASEARMVAQAEALERARRAEVRATKSATDAYNDLSASGNRLLDMLSSLSAGTRLGGVIGDAEALAGRFGGVGLAVGGATVAVAGLAIGIGAAGTALYELGSRWDSVADSITARTGKVGDDLQAVMDQVNKVALDSSVGIEKLGDIAGRLSAFGYAGDQLGTMMDYLGNLNELTGEQTNIRDLIQLYRVFGIEGQDQVGVLNRLADTSRATQIPFNDLLSIMVDSGSEARKLGLNFDQLQNVIKSFTSAGIPAESAMAGLQKALSTIAKDGGDPIQVLTTTIDKIKQLHDAGNDPLANELAENLFGKKGFDEFLTAVEGGKLTSKQLTDQLSSGAQQNVKDIRELKSGTDDLEQEWERFKNFLEVNFEPAATWVFDQFNDKVEAVFGDIRDGIDSIKKAWNWVKDLFGSDSGSSDGPWLGGGGNVDSGSTVRGTPGRGFPMPWTLPPLAGQSARDYAHERMMPYWQSQGFTVGDHAADRYGEHQNGAIDIMVPSIAAGQQVLRQVLSDPNVYGAIFNNQTFGYGHGTTPQDYSAGHTGNPTQDHQDHVHVWYKPGNDGNIKPSGMRAFGPRQSPSLGPQPSDSGPGSVISDDDAARQQAYWDSRSAGTAVGATPLGASTSTPGYDDQGRPGAYVTDPKQIRSSQERIADVNDRIAQADQRIADIRDEIAKADKDRQAAAQERADAEQKAAAAEKEAAAVAGTTLEKDKRAAADSAQRDLQRAKDAEQQAAERKSRLENRDLPDAQAARDRLQNRDLRDATEALADAQRGTFQSARSGSSRSAGGWGAPIAADFGMSGGLAGLAENMTNFLGNLAFAPVFGALSGVSAAGDPTGAYQGAGGLIGMMAAGSGIGGPLGGGPTTVGGIAPTAGTGGAGFGGIGGLPMAGLQAAAASLDAIAPGASIAANMGIQLANRSIAQIGKDVGIGVGGLMETFAMPGADPGQSWFGRIAAGLAGAKPALPNMAGGLAAAPNNGQAHGTGNGAAPGPGGITVNYNNYRATEDRAGKDLTNHLTAMYAGPGS